MSESEHKVTPEFLWGVATSAFQIEGYLENDMTDWEKKGYFKAEGRDPVYHDSIHHWRRWREDFELLRQLGVNSYRFSMDWGRLEPEPAIFDEKALDQYERMINTLLDMKIEPMLTLHHFTHPRWFHNYSPWHEPRSIEIFVRFVQKVLARLGSKIRLYVTFNEPVVWALAAYGDAKFPPGEKNFTHLALCLENILLAHRAVYPLIKRYRPDSEVGIANNYIIFTPERKWNLLDRGLTFLIHRFYNFVIQDAFQKNELKIQFPFLINFRKVIPLDNMIDFWGINYYYRLHIRFRPKIERPMEFNFINASGEGLSDLGWEIYSQGLAKIFQWLKNSRKPLFITENGIADRDDRKRKKFMQAHLKIVSQAVQKNIPMKGYYYWSFLDNYEWLVGHQARFGLVEVQYQNQHQRSIRESGHFFRQFIEKSGQ